MNDTFQLNPINKGMSYDALIDAVKRNFSILLNAYIQGSNVIQFIGAPGVSGNKGERGASLLTITNQNFTAAASQPGILPAGITIDTILETPENTNAVVQNILNNEDALKLMFADNVVINSQADMVMYDAMLFTTGTLITETFVVNDGQRTFTTYLNNITIGGGGDIDYDKLVADVVAQLGPSLNTIGSQPSSTKTFQHQGAFKSAYVPKSVQPDGDVQKALMYLAINTADNEDTKFATLVAGTDVQLKNIYTALALNLSDDSGNDDAKANMPLGQYEPGLLVVQKETGQQIPEPGADADMTLPINKYGLTIVDMDSINVNVDGDVTDGISFSAFTTLTKYLNGVWFMSNSDIRDRYGKFYLSRERYELFITGRYKLAIGSYILEVSGNRTVTVDGTDSKTVTGAVTETFKNNYTRTVSATSNDTAVTRNETTTGTKTVIVHGNNTETVAGTTTRNLSTVIDNISKTKQTTVEEAYTETITGNTVHNWSTVIDNISKTKQTTIEETSTETIKKQLVKTIGVSGTFPEAVAGRTAHTQEEVVYGTKQIKVYLNADSYAIHEFYRDSSNNCYDHESSPNVKKRIEYPSIDIGKINDMRILESKQAANKYLRVNNDNVVEFKSADEVANELDLSNSYFTKNAIVGRDFSQACFSTKTDDCIYERIAGYSGTNSSYSDFSTPRAIVQANRPWICPNLRLITKRSNHANQPFAMTAMIVTNSAASFQQSGCTPKQCRTNLILTNGQGDTFVIGDMFIDVKTATGINTSLAVWLNSIAMTTGGMTYAISLINAGWQYNSEFSPDSIILLMYATFTGNQSSATGTSQSKASNSITALIKVEVPVGAGQAMCDRSHTASINYDTTTLPIKAYIDITQGEKWPNVWKGNTASSANWLGQLYCGIIYDSQAALMYATTVSVNHAVYILDPNEQYDPKSFDQSSTFAGIPVKVDGTDVQLTLRDTYSSMSGSSFTGGFVNYSNQDFVIPTISVTGTDITTPKGGRNFRNTTVLFKQFNEGVLVFGAMDGDSNDNAKLMFIYNNTATAKPLTVDFETNKDTSNTAWTALADNFENNVACMNECLCFEQNPTTGIGSFYYVDTIQHFLSDDGHNTVAYVEFVLDRSANSLVITQVTKLVTTPQRDTITVCPTVNLMPYCNSDNVRSIMYSYLFRLNKSYSDDPLYIFKVDKQGRSVSRGLIYQNLYSANVDIKPEPTIPLNLPGLVGYINLNYLYSDPSNSNYYCLRFMGKTFDMDISELPMYPTTISYYDGDFPVPKIPIIVVGSNGLIIKTSI